MKVAGNHENLLSNDDKGSALLPLLTAFAAMALLSLIVYFFNVPNPEIILLTGAVFFTAIYGFGAGIVASIVTVACSMFFFSEGHSWIHYSAPNLQRMAVIVLSAVANTLLVGNLKRRLTINARQLAGKDQLPNSDSQAPDEASLTDALTGVRNRFGLRQDYNRYEGRYLHVMMLDLDNYRRFNDTYGHAVGDYVLKKLGQQLCEAFGAEGCYRYGGDEFLAVCIDMEEAQFQEKLNALKQGLNGVHLNDKHLPTRFSAGYVYGDCEYSCDLRLMMHQADENLCRAKRWGRDCWIAAPFSRNEAQNLEKNAGTRDRRGMNVEELLGEK